MHTFPHTTTTAYPPPLLPTSLDGTQFNTCHSYQGPLPSFEGCGLVPQPEPALDATFLYEYLRLA
jgi:hypothetical protein